MTKTKNGLILILLLLLTPLACGGPEEGGPDGAAPTVRSTSPADGAVTVDAEAVISATFSTAMNASTVNASTFLLHHGTTAVEGTVTSDGATATFTPTIALPASTPFVATLTTGLEDTAGNALAEDVVWAFTTAAPGDTTSPLVVRAGGAAQVTVTFSEALAPSTISVATFTVTGPGNVPVAGSVNFEGVEAVFVPATAFAEGTLYTATVRGGVSGVTDLAGNALAEDFGWGFTTGPRDSLPPVFLGGAGQYAILAQSAISTVPTSAITGDIAVSPAAASYITGFSLVEATGYATSTQVVGHVFAADYVVPTSEILTTAVNDMETAYTDAAGRPTPDFIELGTGAIGGLVLSPGLYNWTSTVTIASDVVLEGSATDVWIFQVAGDLMQSAGKRVTLRGGAKAANVFWQVAGAVELGTTSHFEGILLCKTAISLRTGASFNGRALAQTAVTLDANVVTQPAP